MNKNVAASVCVLAVCALFVLNSSGCSSREGAPEKKAAHRGALDVARALSGSEPLFVSDYFSFVGADGKGRVEFAIDNDRSRRDDTYTAGAHVVLHDEHVGWVSVSGAGQYENGKEELLSIPDSPEFRFSGDVKTGITLASPGNRLTLVVAPMNERLRRTGSESVYSMGSTSATLMWADRVIPGRVIYEHLFMKNLSPWYSSFSGLFYNDFQGLYLMTDDGGDFYLRTSKSGMRFGTLEDVTGKAAGFEVLDRVSEPLKGLRIEVTERSPGLGLYRWPKSWRVRWQGRKGTGTLTARVVERKIITNWFIGGFAMGVVTGELSYGGKTRHVYGLAELIR